MDTHIHLQDFNDKNATEIINQASKVGVSDFVCVSTNENDWRIVADITEECAPMVIPAFGIHPWFAQKCCPNWDLQLEKYLQKYPNAAVGECGIDNSREINLEIQKQVFAKQIELAKDLNRVLIIHCVRAQEQIEKMWHKLPQRTIFHSFNSKPEFLRQIIKQGFYVGVNFSILRNPNKELILREIPADKLLFETDAPYQPRIKTENNHPTLLPELVKGIATILGIDVEILANQVYKNAKLIFENRKM